MCPSGPLAELARLEARLAEPLPDAQARPPRAVEARSADGRRWLRLELQMLPPWVRDHHGLAGALALSDATAARQAREAAGREGTLLREAARLGQVGAWDIDARSGQLRWSDEAFAIHDLPPGAPPDSATALRYFDVTSRPRLNEAVQQAVQAGVPFDLTLGLVSATGRHKRVRVIGNADLDERGKVARVAGLLHDITDRERHLQALAAQESAERARLALAQAMAQLADQLGTPLGELSGAVARLDDRARELPAWAAAPLQSLQHAAALLGRWMHELHRQALGMGAAQADFDGQVHPARHGFEVALGNRHPSQQSGAAPAAPAAQGCNVLYIEDHPVNARRSPRRPGTPRRRTARPTGPASRPIAAGRSPAEARWWVREACRRRRPGGSASWRPAPRRRAACRPPSCVVGRSVRQQPRVVVPLHHDQRVARQVLARHEPGRVVAAAARAPRSFTPPMPRPWRWPRV
jgi:PAS domain-containing protein